MYSAPSRYLSQNGFLVVHWGQTRTHFWNNNAHATKSSWKFRMQKGHFGSVLGLGIMTAQAFSSTKMGINGTSFQTHHNYLKPFRKHSIYNFLHKHCGLAWNLVQWNQIITLDTPWLSYEGKLRCSFQQFRCFIVIYFCIYNGFILQVRVV